MTLVVLGLDALDHRLVEEYDCEHLSLERSASIESVAVTFDHPLTTEVWPTVATGLHPREHGLVKSGASGWDNPIVDLVSRLLEPVPQSYRRRLGDVAQAALGAQYSLSEVDEPTFMDGPDREVHNWPGVVNSDVLRDRWQTIEKPARDAGYDARRYERRVLAGGAEKFGWVTEMCRHDLELVASHVHVLDMAGHAYGGDPEAYRRYYEWMDERVGELREELADGDDLVIISDHGMGVASIEGDDPGEHTWRAIFATTIDDDPPESVMDVKDWIERHVEPVVADDRDSPELDVDLEQLEDLGYL